MADLRIDLDALQSMRNELVAIQSTFEEAEEIGADVAGYVGHPGLAGVVTDFATKWNLHRQQLIARLKYIDSAVEAVYDTMTETDRKLADSLDKTGTSVA